MAEHRIGLSALKMGGIDATTGLPTSLTSIGDVLQDTVEIMTADTQVTKFKAELKSDPVVVIKEKGEKTFKFTLIELSAANVVSFLGGTVTTASGQKDVWNEPTDTPSIIKSFEITTKDGSVITIYRGDVSGKLVGKFSDTGLLTVEVIVDVLSPLVDGVPALTMQDVTVQP